MKLMIPYFSAPICFAENLLNTLVVENQKLFREIVADISQQIAKWEGKIVLSEEDEPIPMAGNVEMLQSYLDLDLNQKNLLNKVQAILEKTAVDEAHYLETQEVLAAVERYISKLSFACPVDIECGKLTVSNVLKMAGIHFTQILSDPLENLYQYMTLVRELDKEKLFVFVNLRSWFLDEEVETFMQTALSHKFNVLLLDNREYPRFPGEKRTIIDRDLCEI